jgi:DNA-binding GntR family transcriptional regulator
MIAERLNCSTVPVTEALRRLESEGLLVKEPHCIARVRSLSDYDLEMLFLLREALESTAARIAAGRITPEQAGELQGLCDQFDAAAERDDQPGVNQLELAIHKGIVRIADAGLLAEELERLLLIERTAARTLPEGPGPSDYRYSHRAVVQAIADGDAEGAAYLMKRHIRSGYERQTQTLTEAAGHARKRGSRK